MASQFTVSYLFAMIDRASKPMQKVARSAQQTRGSVRGLGSAFNAMESRANSAGTALQRLAMKIRNLRTVGRGMHGGGLMGGGMMAGIGGGIGMFNAARTVKQYADYETALVNVRKVWVGSEEEYQKMLAGLARLNRTLPLTRQQIAGTLEQSIRAGVADNAKELLDATEQFARFGVAFNVPAEQAAVMFSKMRKALSMTSAEFERFGDTANTVANKFPMSELELFEILRRQAALGKSISGMQGAYDVLSIGAAQLAVGTPKEVAATGLRTLLARLNTQPKDTKKALKALGLGSEQIKKMLTKDLFGTVRMIMGKIAALPESKRAGILAQLAGMKSFDAFSRLIANVGVMDDVRKVVEGKFRLTAMSEFQRKLGTMNALFQLTSNVLADFGDSLVRYWDKPIRNALKTIRELARNLSGNPWLAWTAGAYAAASAAALVLLPLGMLAWSIKALGPALATMALAFSRLAQIALWPFFAAAGAGLRMLIGILGGGFLFSAVGRLAMAFMALRMALAGGVIAGGMAALAGVFSAANLGAIGAAAFYIARLVGGFTLIGAAIAYWKELWSLVKGFFSTLSTAYKGSEIQQAVTWLTDGVGKVVTQLGKLMGFKMEGSALKQFFDAGAEAAKALLNPVESIKSALEWIANGIGGVFGKLKASLTSVIGPINDLLTWTGQKTGLLRVPGAKEGEAPTGVAKLPKLPKLPELSLEIGTASGSRVLRDVEKIRAELAKPLALGRPPLPAAKAAASNLPSAPNVTKSLPKLPTPASVPPPKIPKSPINGNAARMMVPPSPHGMRQGGMAKPNEIPLRVRTENTIDVNVKAPGSITLNLPNGAVAGRVNLETDTRARGNASTDSNRTPNP